VIRGISSGLSLALLMSCSAPPRPEAVAFANAIEWQLEQLLPSVELLDEQLRAAADGELDRVRLAAVIADGPAAALQESREAADRLQVPDLELARELYGEYNRLVELELRLTNGPRGEAARLALSQPELTRQQRREIRTLLDEIEEEHAGALRTLRDLRQHFLNVNEQT